MPTPTDTRRDLLTVIAHMRAETGQEQAQAPHLVALAGRLDELLDGGASGLHINRLRRIA